MNKLKYLVLVLAVYSISLQASWYTDWWKNNDLAEQQGRYPYLKKVLEEQPDKVWDHKIDPADMNNWTLKYVQKDIDQRDLDMSRNAKNLDSLRSHIKKLKEDQAKLAREVEDAPQKIKINVREYDESMSKLCKSATSEREQYVWCNVDLKEYEENAKRHRYEDIKRELKYINKDHDNIEKKLSEFEEEKDERLSALQSDELYLQQASKVIEDDIAKYQTLYSFKKKKNPTLSERLSAAWSLPNGAFFATLYPAYLRASLKKGMLILSDDIAGKQQKINMFADDAERHRERIADLDAVKENFLSAETENKEE